jgi:hypothetical protein
VRFKLMVGVVACAALAIVATSAFGAKSAKTTVTITEGGPSLFAGTVSSKEPKCEKGRKVSLLFEEGKRAGEVVGTAKTDAKGNWEMPGNYFAGKYHAEVKAKTVKVQGKGGDIISFLCKLASGEVDQY